jgi:hypothetical protein
MKRLVICLSAVCLLAGLVVFPCGAQAAPRTEGHQQYAQALWNFISDSQTSYTGWTQTGDDLGLPGPANGDVVKTFLNSKAAGSPADMPERSVVVTEHSDSNGQTLAVTVRYKSQDGYDSRYADWYWAHYLPDGSVLKTSADKSPFQKCGFVTIEQDGRVWVFREVSADLVEFLEKGEPAKCVIRPGVGPMGVTLKSSETETILDYVVSKPGFFTKIEDGRLWVAVAGSEEAEKIAAGTELAKRVIRPAAGPLGMTVNAPDNDMLDQYLMGKPGFVIRIVDGRLWVFAEGAPEVADIDAGSEPAKHVIRPGAGPGGMTLKSPDTETILAYVAAQDGFQTFIKDERIWVFPKGSPDVEEFKESGEPAKYVTRPGAGPLGMTVKGPDSEIIESYLRVALVPGG